MIKIKTNTSRAIRIADLPSPCWFIDGEAVCCALGHESICFDKGAEFPLVYNIGDEDPERWVEVVNVEISIEATS